MFDLSLVVNSGGLFPAEHLVSPIAHGDQNQVGEYLGNEVNCEQPARHIKSRFHPPIPPIGGVALRVWPMHIDVLAILRIEMYVFCHARP